MTDWGFPLALEQLELPGKEVREATKAYMQGIVEGALMAMGQSGQNSFALVLEEFGQALVKFQA